VPVVTLSLLLAGLVLSAGTPDAGARSETPPDTKAGSQDAYWQVVQDHLPQLNTCYVAEVRSRPPNGGPVPGGTLKAQWTVLDGKVLSVKVLSKFSGASDHFTSCAMDSIRSWHFPKRRTGSVVMTYPFVFLLQPDAGRP